MTKPIDLTSLLGSRICHDLISPLGAIGNGVELLSMSGVVAGPEMSLISESVENASARIRFFRVAFGAASEGQVLPRSEIAQILAGLGKAGRLTILWQIDGAVPRAEAKLAFLCLQCLESAMPWGGRITVTRRDRDWSLTADSGKLRDLAPLWSVLGGTGRAEDLAAADIQFALAPLWAGQCGLRLTQDQAPGRIALSFAPA